MCATWIAGYGELQNCLGKCWRDFLARARSRLSAASEKALFRELSRPAAGRAAAARFREGIDHPHAGAPSHPGANSPNKCAPRPEGAQPSPRTGGPAAAPAGNPAPPCRMLETAPGGSCASAGNGSRGCSASSARRRRSSAATASPVAANGKVIRRVAEAKTRTRIKTRVRDGEFESTRQLGGRHAD